MADFPVTDTAASVAPESASIWGSEAYRRYNTAKARYYLAVAEQSEEFDRDEEKRIDELSDRHSEALRSLMLTAADDISTVAYKLQVFQEEELAEHRLGTVFLAAIAEDAKHLSMASN